MKNWIKNIFQKKKEREILEWETNDSILFFLRQVIDDNGKIDESNETLPDEKIAEDKVKFAPGLMDAMFGADNSVESTKRINILVKQISKISKSGNQQSKSEFYREITTSDSVIGIIDDFLQKVVQLSLPIEPYLYSFAHSLATKTNNRNSVKFGIAILGLCQNKEPIEDIKILGLHDEFTVYSTIALANLSDNLANDLWYLAKRVDGWGKIQIVDRLAQMKLSDEIIDWLVYEGYKNSIMHEYLALTCAVNGKLNDKLFKESIDEKLFESAGEIIVALMDEGPAEGMSTYENSNETIQNYLRHARKQIMKISDFITLNRIKDYLEDPENEILKTWSQESLSNCLIDVNEVLNSKDWTTDIQNALKSSDNYEYWNGKLAAQKLGLNIWDTLWNRLIADPFNSTYWYDVTTNAKPEKAIDIVEQAVKHLPLKEISTGPKDSMGIGPEYQKHQSLDFIITFLENYPRLGEELILAGLKSPVTRNRNMTLNTLEKWTPENWSTEIKDELNILKKIEPNSDTKENIRKLLKGETLE